MACTARELQRPLLHLLASLVTIVWASRASVTAVRIGRSFRADNAGCGNFAVEHKCVNAILSDGINGYKFAYVNLEATPDVYLLAVVWTAYPDFSLQHQRIVWSANRNHPVETGSTVVFTLNGSLVLYGSDGSEVWSTNTQNMGVTGIELNSSTGELILVGARNEAVWSSFSHPTDTIVAGQQLVWPGMQLVSGKSSTDNSEGAFSLVMQPAGLVLYASLPNAQPYFVWNYFAQSKLEAMPVSSLLTTCYSPVTLELSGNGQVSLSNSSSLNASSGNSNQNYTSQAQCSLSSNYNTIKTNSYPNKANMSYMVLESDGKLKVYFYTKGGLLTTDYDFFNETECDLPQICGRYGVCTANGVCECPPDSVLSLNSSNSTGGCSSSQGLLGASCSANSKVQFGQVRAVDYFPNRFNTPTGNYMSMSECESQCEKNCSCAASFYNSESGACYTVLGPLSSMMSSPNSNLTASVKISSVADIAQKNNLGRAALYTGCGVAVFVVFVVILGLVIHFKSKNKARLVQDEHSKENEFLESLPGLPPRYSKKELDAATMGFTKKLGSGAFGTVYEGTLRDGSKIAVKKLENLKSTKDFRAEMATLGSIHHINLVRLRGFCVEGPHNMLVYEFMPNGSLDRWLFNQASKRIKLMSLDWNTRFKIALGTARGLAYLHQDCSERIIHLDVKPQNILLDQDFNPKVADFGLSKLVDREETIVMTTLRGTPGYLAPEWLLQGGITQKTDVYSYGIVLLELIAGRKCLDLSAEVPRQQYLPGWVLRHVLQGDELEVVDPRLDIKGSEDQVTNAVHIALECIQEEMTHRPSMGDVVQMLEGFLLVPELEKDTLSFKYRFLNYQDLGASGEQSSDSKSSFSIPSSVPTF